MKVNLTIYYTGVNNASSVVTAVANMGYYSYFISDMASYNSATAAFAASGKNLFSVTSAQIFLGVATVTSSTDLFILLIILLHLLKSGCCT